VARLEADCRRVRILATTREPMRIAGELVLRTRLLDVPRPGATPAEGAHVDAVRLFMERARQADPSFELDDTTFAEVAAICRAVDGLPLAIELAAARYDLPERQRALAVTVERSHALLTEQERTAFGRLSVFDSSFTVEEAEAVIAYEPIDPAEVLDLICALVDKSLLLPESPANSYRMLRVIREYAREQLPATGTPPTQSALSS
jgi:predicted ATPase